MKKRMIIIKKKVINISEQEKNSPENQEAQKKIDEIMKELDQIKRDQYDTKKINPEEFEKDHDENGHIDFIHAGANLRARNYTIDECDRNKTKQIAGKIIPTILTTTATIAGIVSLQFYTMLQTDDIKFFRECILDLRANKFFFGSPHPPIKMKDKEPTEKTKPRKAIPEGWNSWDRIEIKGSKIIKELNQFIKEKYNVEVETLFIDGKTIYDSFLPGLKKNIDLKIEDVYEKIINSKINEKKNYLLINVIGIISEAKINEQTYKDVYVNMPLFKYYFR